MLNHIFVTDDDNSDSILPELPRIKPAIQPPPPTPKTNIFQDVGDVALAGAKGVVGAAQGLVGLADIPTGGHAGKFIQDRVIDLPNVSNWLGSLQSQKQQENEAALQNANGFVNTLGVLADRPSLIPSAIAESIPSMYAGAGIGRATGVVANALGKGISSKVLPFLGEGEIMAGQQAENIRQQSPDQLLSPGGTAATLGTGILGSGVAALGGRLANRAGVSDTEQVIFNNSLGRNVPIEATPFNKNFLTRGLTAGAIESGEEAAQSAGEQGFENLATGQPVTKGMGNAIAMGAVTAFPMGAVPGALGNGPLARAADASLASANATNTSAPIVEPALNTTGAAQTSTPLSSETIAEGNDSLNAAQAKKAEQERNRAIIKEHDNFFNMKDQDALAVIPFETDATGKEISAYSKVLKLLKDGMTAKDAVEFVTTTLNNRQETDANNGTITSPNAGNEENVINTGKPDTATKPSVNEAGEPVIPNATPTGVITENDAITPIKPDVTDAATSATPITQEQATKEQQQAEGKNQVVGSTDGSAQDAVAIESKAQDEVKPFVSTHELPDGTQVIPVEGENNVWLDANNEEHISDYATLKEPTQIQPTQPTEVITDEEKSTNENATYADERATDEQGQKETLLDTEHSPTSYASGIDPIDVAHEKIFGWLNAAAKSQEGTPEKALFNKYSSSINLASKANIDDVVENNLIGLLDAADVKAPDNFDSRNEWLDYVNEALQYKRSQTPLSPPSSETGAPLKVTQDETAPGDDTGADSINPKFILNDKNKPFKNDKLAEKSIIDNPNLSQETHVVVKYNNGYAIAPITSLTEDEYLASPSNNGVPTDAAKRSFQALKKSQTVDNKIEKSAEPYAIGSTVLYNGNRHEVLGYIGTDKIRLQPEEGVEVKPNIKLVSAYNPVEQQDIGIAAQTDTIPKDSTVTWTTKSGKVIQGTVNGITDKGKLKITANGKLFTKNQGDVKLVSGEQSDRVNDDKKDVIDNSISTKIPEFQDDKPFGFSEAKEKYGMTAKEAEDQGIIAKGYDRFYKAQRWGVGGSWDISEGNFATPTEAVAYYFETVKPRREKSRSEHDAVIEQEQNNKLASGDALPAFKYKDANDEFFVDYVDPETGVINTVKSSAFTRVLFEIEQRIGTDIIIDVIYVKNKDQLQDYADLINTKKSKQNETIPTDGTAVQTAIKPTSDESQAKSPEGIHAGGIKDNTDKGQLVDEAKLVGDSGQRPKKLTEKTGFYGTVTGLEELQTAIKKLGGIRVDKEKEQQFADYMNVKFKSLFNQGKNSKTFDDMATLLSQPSIGFDFGDLGENGLRELLALSLKHGDEQYTPQGWEAKMERDYANDEINRASLPDDQANWAHDVIDNYTSDEINDAESVDDFFNSVATPGSDFLGILQDENDTGTAASIDEQNDTRTKEPSTQDTETGELSGYTESELKQREAEKQKRLKAEQEQQRRDEVIKREQDSGFDVFDDMAGLIPTTNDVFGMKTPIDRVDESKDESDKAHPTDTLIDKEDIPYELAKRAYIWISFSPEARAKQEQERYIQHMRNVYDSVIEYAKTDEQTSTIIDAFIKYKEGYIAKAKSHLLAKSKVMSPMITGPANFPVARNEKAKRLENKRLNELLEWDKKAQKHLMSVALATRSKEEITNDRLNQITQRIASSLETIKEIDDGTNTSASRPLFVNSIVGTIKTLSNNGETYFVNSALDFIEAYQKDLKKPLISAKHSIWELRDKTNDSKEAFKKEQGIVTLKEYKGARVVNNHELDRVQILFDEKPSAEVINTLKKTAFKWSPTNKAWQRQNTNNGITVAKNMLDKFYEAGNPKISIDDKNNIQFSKKLNNDIKNLAIIHNLSLDNLEHADKIGGLAVPSIAVVNKDFPLVGFGEISLIGSKETFAPNRENKIFDADIYSPRYPYTENKVNPKELQKINDSFSDMAHKLADGSVVYEDTLKDKDYLSRLQNSNAVMYEYLKENGANPQVIYKAKSELPKELIPYTENYTNKYAIEDNKDFQLYVAKLHNDKTNENLKNASNPALTRMYKNSLIDLNDPNDLIRNAKLYAFEIDQYLMEQKSGPKIDTYETGKKLSSQITNKEEFNSWIKNKVKNAIEKSVIPHGETASGNRKYLSHTLENVVKLMKKELRGGESFNYGAASLRSHLSKQFKNIHDIQKSRDNLVSKTEMDKLAAESNNIYSYLTEKVGNELGDDSRVAEYLLEDVAKNGWRVVDKAYRKVLSPELKQEVNEFLDLLKHYPTEYFEGKVQRAVGLNEFSGAVVPSGNEYDKAIDILKQHGITQIERYDANDINGRAKAVNKFSDLLFSKDNNKTTNPHTKATLTKAIDGIYGADWTRRLLGTGKVEIIGDADIEGVIGDKALFHKVWHGSPHDHNKFDSKYNKTGESINAFGEGHYFTEDKRIAEWYRDKLSSGYYAFNYENARKWLADKVDYDVYEKYGRDYELVETDDGIAAVYKNGKEYLADENYDYTAAKRVAESMADKYIKADGTIRDEAMRLGYKNKGKLYEVELAPTQEEYLDWDKPLSEQSEKVKGIINSYIDGFLNKELAGRYKIESTQYGFDVYDKKYGRYLENNGNYNDTKSFEEWAKNRILKDANMDSGNGIYNYFVKQFTNNDEIWEDLGKTPFEVNNVQSAASQYLHSLGIRGIRYKAAGGQSDANNYVIFDDNDIKIEAKYSKDGKIQALYNPATDKSYLVYDNISKDDNVKGLIIHDVVVHQLKMNKGDKEFQAILSEVKRLKKDGDKAILEAFSRVPEDTTPGDVTEETLAYLTQYHPELPIVKRFIAWIKAQLRKLGKALPPLDKAKWMQWANTLSSEDLVYMAHAALKSAPESLMFDGVGSDDNTIKRAQAAGYKGNDRSESEEWLRAVAKGLDMSQEARMQRAKAMGFDVDTVWHHGTNDNFDYFDKVKLGDNTLSNASNDSLAATSLLGFWFNSEPMIGKKHSPYSKDVPVYLKVGENVKTIDSVDNLAYELESYLTNDLEENYDNDRYFYLKNSADSYVKSLGSDSIIIENDEEFGGKSIIVFDPSQIRSINAAFDPDYSDSPNLLASSTTSRFYSALTKMFRDAPAKIFGNPQQVKTWLNSNTAKFDVKKDEVYWSGINDWLDMQTGKVSQDDVMAFLKENGVKVEDVVLGNEKPTKHNTETLTLPGGKDYKELVVTIPTVEKFNEGDATHFGDVGSGKQIAWLRLNTRTDSNGNPSLFLEEVQSQRGSEGRTNGWIGLRKPLTKLPDGYTIKSGNNKFYPLEKTYWVENEYGEIISTEEETAEDAADQALWELNNPQGKVPPAPFITDSNNKATNAYITLLLKKAVSEAIDNGQQSVSWTTGMQQADRYDLKNQLKKVGYDFYKKELTYTDLQNKSHSVPVSPNARDIAEYIGDDLAEKLLSKEPDQQFQVSLSGNELESKSAWTAAMYGDKKGLNTQGKPSMVMQAANDIARKFGGRVESIKLDTGMQPALIITPEMKAKILHEGMPLFSQKDAQIESLVKQYASDKEAPTRAEIAEAVKQYRDIEAQYKGTEQWMKAPNGKPTNLNETQWVMVQTPNFKRWFGDSKVVDENGEPLLITDISPFEASDYGVSSNTETSSYIRKRIPVILHIDSLIQVPATFSDIKGIINTDRQESTTNSRLGTPNNFGYFARAFPFSKQESDSIIANIISSHVKGDVFGTRQNSKVTNSVIKFIPINVMDMLINSKFSTNMSRHNNPMLENLIPVNRDSFVSVSNASSPLKYIVAIPGTKESFISNKFTIPNRKNIETSRAENFVLHGNSLNGDSPFMVLDYKYIVKKSTGNIGTFNQSDNIKYSKLSDAVDTVKSYANSVLTNEVINKPMTSAQFDRLLATGEWPTESILNKQDFNDKVATLFVDATRPFDVWARKLIDGNELVAAKDRAHNRRAAYEEKIMYQFGNGVAEAMKAFSKEYDKSYMKVKEISGRWMSARWSIIKNNELLQGYKNAVDDAQIIYQDAVDAVTNAPIDIDPTASRNLYKERALAKTALTNAQNKLTKFKDAKNGPVKRIEEQPEEIGLAGGYNDATAKDIITRIESKYKKSSLESIAKPIYDMLEFNLYNDFKNGKVTQEFYDKFNGQRLYVPLTGDPRNDVADDDFFHAGSVNQAKDKRLLGRTTSIAQNAIDAAFEQVEKSARYHGWVDFKDALTKVYEDGIKDIMDNDPTISLVDAQKQFAKYIGITRTKEGMTTRSSDDVIIVRKNGEAWVYDIHNEPAMKALKSMNQEDVPTLLKPFNFATRLTSRLVTQFMPTFAPINAIRDIWEKSENIRARTLKGYNIDMNKVGNDAIKNATSLKLLRVLAGVMAKDTAAKNKFPIINDPLTQIVEEFLEEGGLSTYGTLLGRDSEQLAKQLQTKLSIPGKVMDVISAYNNTFELASSIGVYMALLDQGVAKKDAVTTTLNLMNFGKSGSLMVPVRALWMFANPVAQGGHQLIQTLSTKKGQARFVAYTMAAMMLYMFLRGLADDDDELGVNKLDQAGNYNLERNIVIPLGGDNYFKIPVGFGMPQLALATSMNLVKFLSGSQTIGESTTEIGKNFFRSIAPISPSEDVISAHPLNWLFRTASPQLVRPIGNVVMNKGSFGQELANEGFSQKGKSNALQGRHKTAQEWKDVAMYLTKFGIDMYPEHIKELFDGYMVGPFKEMAKYMIENPNKQALGKNTVVPALDRFILSQNDDDMTTKIFYRKYNELQDISKKQSLGKSLDAKEQKLFNIYQLTLKKMNAARGKKAAATRAYRSGNTKRSDTLRRLANNQEITAQRVMIKQMLLIGE